MYVYMLQWPEVKYLASLILFLIYFLGPSMVCIGFLQLFEREQENNEKKRNPPSFSFVAATEINKAMGKSRLCLCDNLRK